MAATTVSSDVDSGLDTHRAYANFAGNDYRLSGKKVVVMNKDPRRLVAAIDAPLLSRTVLVAHAPHSAVPVVLDTT